MLDLLLFAGAVIGHFALTVRSHNWWYGSALGRHTIDALQLLHGLLFLTGPVLFWLAVRGFDLRGLFSSTNFSLRMLGGYVAVCWLVGFVVLPVVVLMRLSRRCPTLLSCRSRVIDIAAQLGRKPAGDGKRRRLALLPFNEVFQVELSEKTLALPRLPQEWDGLSILHLSDLHFCGTPSRDYYERLLDACMEWRADLIALTGDYVDSVAHLDWMAPLLGRLKAPEGVLAIRGNHDLWYAPEGVSERLHALGFHVLTHQPERMTLRGLPLVVVGHEGPWIKPPPDLTGLPPDLFRLCLSHTPDNMAWARREGIDLMLSGHVHGGQIRVPLIGSIVVPSKCGRRYDCGVFEEGRTVLHVSRGLGGEHPLRFRCRPEATLLRLVRPLTASPDAIADDRHSE